MSTYNHANAYNQKNLDNGVITLDDITDLVRAFQDANGLVPDGMCGPKTLAQLRGHRTKPVSLGALLHPMPRLPDGRLPTLTSGHYSVNPSRPTHMGADFLYKQLPGDAPAGKVYSDGKWWVPKGLSAVACARAEVMYIQDRANGFAVTLQLHDGTRLIYRHLESPALGLHQGGTIEAGQAVGIVGHTMKTTLVHLHFEVYAPGRYAYAESIDPGAWLQGSTYV